MRRQIEILAPAGSYESMRAAMNAGCDAVYIGGSSFGARAYANNLDEETLLRAIDEAHIRDKKLYLTVNTLVKEKELTEGLYHFLEKFYLEGLDAVIVQDVGVMHFIHRNFPKLPIHASTQTTITMAQGADSIKSLGVTRLVTARELSLKEIKTIRENTDLEIETFVHGALCYCYSGQCLLSSMIGGRSGNRGRCAQPCRMPYKFYSEDRKLSSDQERYLLSPRDMNTVALIPELIEAGIDSFKIEGRMKRPEYSAGVSAIYRKYTDLYFELGKQKYKEYLQNSDYEMDMKNLLDLYNRGGFSEGYGKLYHGKKMMSLSRPNHSGLYVGTVTRIISGQAAITLTEDINAQDILEIRKEEDDEQGYEFTVKDPVGKGKVLRTNIGFNQVKAGAKVYRTKNTGLLNSLTAQYLDKDRKQGIRGILSAKAGEKLSLTLFYKDYSVTAYGDITQTAIKQPMTKEKLSAPIEKLGDTLFYFKELTIDTMGDIFVPVAWLNEIRRDAIQLLLEVVINDYRRKPENREEAKSEVIFRETEAAYAESNKKEAEAAYTVGNIKAAEFTPAERKIKEAGDIAVYADTNEVIQNSVAKVSGTRFEIIASIQTMDQFRSALAVNEISSIYADYDKFSENEIHSMAKKAFEDRKGFYLILPHICRLSIYERLKNDIVSLLNENNINGFIIKNFEEFELLQSFHKNEPVQKPVISSDSEIILDHNMYVFNNEAKKFWHSKGLNHFTAPVECNFQELKLLGLADCDMIVYGHLPLMVSAQCLHESTGGCARDRREQREEYLVDRLGMKFFVQTSCNGCYNTIYNGQCLSLMKQVKEINILHPQNIRLNFTIEDGNETKNVLSLFVDAFCYGRESASELQNLTTGHFRRGVE